ncbi:MAG: hypothetical protein R3328_00180 [Planococcaceae bacterium]|nr:hypothetical protein [Planococcaceae bacterium]
MHRELLDKPIWEGSTPEQKVILVTLLTMANHKEKEWEFKGERYKASSGQFVTSLDSIVKKAGNGISVRNVRTALQRFEKYDFLTSEPTNKNRLITIVNWAVYQQKEDDVTSEVTSNRQATDKQLTTNKNVRTKEDINTVHSDELFEIWWTLYNNKTGRAKCITKYKTLLKKYSHETMIVGTEKYLNHRKGLVARNEFLPQQKNPLTFLNGEHFNDEYGGQAVNQTNAPNYKPLVVDYSKGED